MNPAATANKTPVLMLYNLNPEWEPGDREEARNVACILSSALQEEGHAVNEICLEDDDLVGLLQPFSPHDGVILNWCEEIPGIPHSYHIIAATLEELGFTYTGADSRALALSQDKRLVKKRLDDHGICTPRWKIFDSNREDGWNCFPAIVKPALDHCSLGITSKSVVYSKKEMEDRISYINDAFHGPALVEEFIDGRELHVTVVGDGRLHMLPPAEMDFSGFEDPRDRLCSYESKFDPQSEPYNIIKLHLPARLSSGQISSLEKTALQAYRALDCRDYARLDIRLQGDLFYVLDVNPNADISPDTSPVLAAELIGLTYGKLGSLLTELAARRHPSFSLSLNRRGILETINKKRPARNLQQSLHTPVVSAAG